MSTTITYDIFKFHAANAEVRTIYASDFNAGLDGWTAASTSHFEDHAGGGPGSPSGTGSIHLRADTGTGSHYMQRDIFTIGKKYKVSGKVYINSGNPILKVVRIHDGYGVTLGNITDQDQWVSFDVEFTAVSELLVFYGMNCITSSPCVPGYTWASAGADPFDDFYIADIVVTEITDGFPTPYVSRNQTPISYGNRWAQGTSFSLNGQITGHSFNDLIDKQEALLSGFARDFKTLDITEDGESVAGFPAKNCLIKNISFDGDKYTNILDYGIDIDVYDETLFSGTFGVLEPNDEIAIEEGADGSINVSHSISAKGIPTDNKTSIENAKDFVHMNTGWKEQAAPRFINYQRFKDKYSYVSDFDGGDDDWTANHGSKYNTQTIDGKISLKYIANDDDSSDHNIVRNFSNLTIGKKYKIEALVYIGDTAPLEYNNIKVIEISNSSTAGQRVIAEGGKQGDWIFIESEFTAYDTNLYFKAKESSTDYQFLGNANLDWFAVTSIKVKEVIGFIPILLSQTESINRMEGTYSVGEAYSLFNTGENKLISGYTVDVSSGIGQDFTTVNLKANYKGYFGEGLDEIRNKIPTSTSIGYHGIATRLSQVSDLNTGANAFNVIENSGSSSIEINATYDNNTLFTGSDAHFDYKVSCRTDATTSNTTIGIQGLIAARGNKKDRLRIAEDFLENTVYAQLGDCNNETKYACYLYGIAKEEYANLFGTNIYTSIFGPTSPNGNDDGWATNNMAISWIADYAGETDVLRCTPDGSGETQHWLFKNFNLVVGKRYKLTGKYYIQTGGPLKGIQIIEQGEGTFLHRCDNCTGFTWIDFSIDFIALDSAYNRGGIYIYGSDSSGDTFFTAPGDEGGNSDFAIKDFVITEIPYFLRPYPNAASIQKDRDNGTIVLTAAFDDKYELMLNESPVSFLGLKTSTWSVNVKPPLRKYLPTTDIMTSQKHIFWNTQVLVRSTILANSTASSYDAVHASFGKVTVDSFLEKVYNVYVSPNSDISENQHSLSFNEKNLLYNKSTNWGFHNANEWVTLPAPPKP